MSNLRSRFDAARRQLPRGPLIGLASICFSLAVLTSPFTTSPFTVYIPLELFAAAFYAFALHWILFRPPLHFPPIQLPLAAFLWANLISIWWAAILPLNRRTWYMLLILGILVLAGNVIVKERHLVTLYQILFLESALGGLVSIWQFVRQYQVVIAQHPDRFYYYMTVTRTQGFTINAVIFGCQQMLIFASLLSFLLFSRRAHRVWWVVMAIIGISIALNLTRSVWLGCFAAGVYLLARRRPRWLGFMPVALVVAYLAAPSLLRDRTRSVLNPSADYSITQRFEMWDAAVRMIKRHPWAGVGAENIERGYLLYLPGGRPSVRYYVHLHSNVLHLAAERGLPTLAAWLWLMLTLFWQFWKIRGRLSGMRWIADAGIAAWLAIVAQGFFDYNFGIYSVLILFLFLAAAPFAAEFKPTGVGSTAPSQSPPSECVLTELSGFKP